MWDPAASGLDSPDPGRNYSQGILPMGTGMGLRLVESKKFQNSLRDFKELLGQDEEPAALSCPAFPNFHGAENSQENCTREGGMG